MFIHKSQATNDNTSDLSTSIITVAIKHLLKLEKHSEIGGIDHIFRYYGSTPGYAAFPWVNCNINIISLYLIQLKHPYTSISHIKTTDPES